MPFAEFPLLTLISVETPCRIFFLSIILIIPAVPSASYFADGLVMISISFILVACINCNASELGMAEGLPSIKSVNPCDPLKETLPSISTETLVILAKT